jgi:hypothetical protein
VTAVERGVLNIDGARKWWSQNDTFSGLSMYPPVKRLSTKLYLIVPIGVTIIEFHFPVIPKNYGKEKLTIHWGISLKVSV